MADAGQEALLQKSVKEWNHWRKRNPNVIPNLERANFTKANLSGADLSGANLERAFLAQADLKGANLQGAVLKGANLSKTDLRGFNFSGFDLRKTAFSRANLSEVDFSGAILEGANLSDATLIRVNFKGALLCGVIFNNVYLIGFDFKGFDLSRTSFKGSKLRKTDFTRAILTDTNFSYADLTNAIIIKSFFKNANLTGTNLSGFDLGDLDLRKTKLSKAILIEVNLSNSILAGVNLNSANLTRANLSKANLYKADLSEANLSETNLSEANLQAVNLSNTNLSGFNFSRFNLSRANLSNTNLCRANFTETNLEEANLSGANLSEANFEKTNLKGTYFIRANLSKFNFSGFNLSNVKFRGANLADANFSGADLRGADFGFDLSTANFSHRQKTPSILEIRQAILRSSTILTGANFSEANLEGTNLENANLERANFYQACLKNAEISGANLTETNFEEADLEGIYFTRDIIRAIRNKIVETVRSNVEAHAGSIGSDYERGSKANKILRYPYIDCPTKTLINQPFSLYTQLLLEPPELDSTAVQIEDIGTLELPKIELVLRCCGFNIEGSNTQVMEVDRAEDSEVRFVLTPYQIGQQEIRVDYYQYGRRIGTTRCNILVVERFTPEKAPPPAPSVAIQLKVNQTVPPPDLELCVILDRHDGRTLYYELHSVKQELDYHHAKVGQVTLQATPLEKMQAVYRQLSELAALNPNTQNFPDEQRKAVLFSSTTQMNPERVERRLVAVGNQLWDELVSDELKQQYWQFKEQVKSILITSDEPWVPWEIIKPYRHINGKEEQAPFWCQQFAISRWLSGPGTADDLPAKVVLPVAPSQSNLSSVQEEIAFLAQLTDLRSGLSPVAALHRGLDLEDYIRENEFSILHFACHGMFDDTSPNDSAIVLADGPLRPSDLRLYFDQKQPRPIIFINACHGGRVGFSFTGLGGWAERLVKARVGAFVGAMWEVNDTLALQFARAFYKALLQDNQTVAEAFRQSREAIRQIAPYNSTWLAYSLYADPEARIQEEPDVDKESTSSFSRTIFSGTTIIDLSDL